MLYLSQLLGTPVVDLQGVRLGKVIDMLIPLKPGTGQSGATYPNVLLVAGEEDTPLRIPLTVVERRDATLRIGVTLEQLTQQTAMAEPEVHLAQDVLDKQVIDIAGKKAIRVNDVCLDDDWRILGIDSSTLGLLRRLVPPWLLRQRSRPTTLIPWERTELLGTHHSEEEMPASTQSGHLAELHPADIATIVHQLTPGQGARLIERLDDETAADTMEEIDTDRQRHILENIQTDRAADILEAMEPDKAADLLAQLPEERVQQFLRLMTPKESEDVQELLEYAEDSAGGLMTTDYIVLHQTRTVTEALAAVRRSIHENDIRTAYIYCVADEAQDESRIVGVVSIWDLLVATPTQSLQDVMETNIITVQPDTDARTVAEIMAKYNLLAVPVVRTDGILEGVVTVDDALDLLLPAARRPKPRRMY